MEVPHYPEALRLFVNAVYFPNWKIYDGCSPGLLNPGCISHIYYAFVG